MQISPSWLKDAKVQKLFSVLTDAGYQAFAVGGCVRNSLMGLAITDIDISTNARPEQVQSLFEAAAHKTLPTGIEHGTITVIIDTEPFEITSFRKDVATDGRRAVVAFADTIDEDAMRRDFTMNALYLDQHGQVHDPVGGLADLEKRIFRFIGDADQRIAEDYLRILRFFRFNAFYGDAEAGIDADGLAACAAGAEGLAKISAERITQEMCKLLSAQNPAPAIATMAQTGILRHVLEGASMDALAPLIHFEEGAPTSWQTRLAAISMAADLSTLRLSKSDTRQITELREAAQSTLLAHAIGYRLGVDQGRNALLLRAALLEQPPLPDMNSELTLGAAAPFPLKANDLPSLLQGPEIGKALKGAEAIWIESRFTKTKQELLDELD